MKGIRTAVLGAALAFSITSIAEAQGQGQARGAGRGNNPQAQMQTLLKDITVSADVTTKVEAILVKLMADRREIMMAARGNAAGGGGAGGGRGMMMDSTTMAKVGDLQTKAYAEIKTLLTADQAKTFDVNVEAMRNAQATRMRPPPQR